MADYTLEAAAGLDTLIFGVDEVGRGPFAGPVCAAAVALEPDRLPPDLLGEIDDSKRLTANRRTALAKSLAAHVAFAVAWASVEEIDALNILEASHLAMRRAIVSLSEQMERTPGLVLIDGNRCPGSGFPEQAVVGGDGRSLSIAAASILAKVDRDQEMVRLATEYPGYGWERNAGYGTAEHRKALARLGVTPHHRRSFAPVRIALGDLGTSS